MHHPKLLKERLHGLDVLRALAIILVFMGHYRILADPTIFKLVGTVGVMGVDLFFVLSGYLIATQIFSGLVKNEAFSFKLFYCKRFLKTLPSYFFVLAIYFLIPEFAERPLETPLWKFLTFTQNFGLHPSGFSQAWSLCVEEQFYLVLPIASLLIFYKGSIRLAWFLVIAILLFELGLRAVLWVMFVQNAGENAAKLYTTHIYYPTYCRLDGLIFGVAIALVKNFHIKLWERLISHSRLLLIVTMLGYALSIYLFLNGLYFLESVFSFFVVALSSAAFLLIALNPNHWLYRVKIPGAMILATWSYAIYLTHKQLIHLTFSFLGPLEMHKYKYASFAITVVVCLLGGWILYRLVEKPFLKLRDRLIDKSRDHIKSSKQIIADFNN